LRTHAYMQDIAWLTGISLEEHYNPDQHAKCRISRRFMHYVMSGVETPAGAADGTANLSVAICQLPRAPGAAAEVRTRRHLRRFRASRIHSGRHGDVDSILPASASCNCLRASSASPPLGLPVHYEIKRGPSRRYCIAGDSFSG